MSLIKTEWVLDCCWDGVWGCYCKSGYPLELQCPRCRDSRSEEDNKIWCRCFLEEDDDFFPSIPSELLDILLRTKGVRKWH